MSEQELLRANQAFYTAFAAGDLAAMEALWARRTDIACIHPGWRLLVGREAVVKSWAAILGNPPPIGFADARAFMLTDGGFVLCTEHVGRGVLVATNIFVLEEGAWRMVHHQAGPATAAGSGDASEAKPQQVH